MVEKGRILPWDSKEVEIRAGFFSVFLFLRKKKILWQCLVKFNQILENFNNLKVSKKSKFMSLKFRKFCIRNILINTKRQILYWRLELFNLYLRYIRIKIMRNIWNTLIPRAFEVRMTKFSNIPNFQYRWFKKF